MAAVVGGDVTQIQDEDLLRRMWQDTEDFGRKKEIRARMYKLREQRLKEFYTTGEVLSDVLTTGSVDSVDALRNSSSTISNKHSHQQVVQKSASYTTSSSGGNFAITHADSLADEGFMTLKSKEIRDSESPTRDFHRRQQTNKSGMNSSQEFQSRSSQDDGGQGYWKVAQESSSGEFHSTGTMGDNGEMIVRSRERSEQSKVTGGSDTDGLTRVSQASAKDDTCIIPSNKGAIKDSTDDKNTSIVVSSDAGGKHVTTSSSSKSWSSSSKSQSSTSSKSSSTIVHRDSGFSDDFHKKGDGDLEILQDGSSNQQISRSSSSTRFSQSNSSSNSANQGKHRITQRSSTTEMPVGDFSVAKDDTVPSAHSDTVERTTVVVGKSTTDVKSGVVSEGRRTSNVSEQRIVTEVNDSNSYSNKGGSTSVSTGDARNWTVVSSQTPGECGTDKTTEEFIFRSGHTDDVKEPTSHINTSFISNEKASSVTSKTIVDREPQDKCKDAKAPQSRESSPEKRPSVSGAPTDVGKKGIMKQPSQETIEISPDQYVTTYQQHYTTKRISVDNDPTHDAFARSLRSSPERGTPNSTRSSSKVSLDRASPTRNYRNKTSADSSLVSLNSTSPSRKSPGRSSPDKNVNRSTSPTKSATKQSPSTESTDQSGPRSSPTRSSPDKMPGHVSPNKGPSNESRKSPIRGASPDKSSRKTSRTSPSRDDIQKVTSSSTDRVVSKTIQTKRSSDNDSNRTSPVKGLGDRSQKSPGREVSPGKTPRRSSSARNSPDKDTYGTLRTRKEDTDVTVDKSSKAPSRRVSAGDKPKTDVTSKISITSTIKEKRRLSSGLSREATKKKCSTPGASPSTSPTYSERQSRPRSRGSSRASSGSDGSDSETKTYTRDTEEETRRYQQQVTNKEEELMTTGFDIIRHEMNRNKNVLDALLLQQERPNEDGLQHKPVDSNTNTEDNIKRYVHQQNVETNLETSKNEVTTGTGKYVPKERDNSPEVNRSTGSSPMKGKSHPQESPVGSSALSKFPREKSPEYSSEGSLANELPRRPTSTNRSPTRDAASPVKQMRAAPERKDSPDSSPERISFAPIKCFRTSPEERPSMLELNGTQAAPKPTLATLPLDATSPIVAINTTKGIVTDDSFVEDVKIEVISTKEVTKPEKPISTRPDIVRKSPERPSSSPVSPDALKSSPTKGSPSSVRGPGNFKPSRGVDRVPELTRRSPTPDSLRRRGNNESNSSSVSPCSSPERHSDRENALPNVAPKKSQNVKKTGVSEKSPRGFSPEKASPTRGEPKRHPDASGKSPQKPISKKSLDQTYKKGPDGTGEVPHSRVDSSRPSGKQNVPRKTCGDTSCTETHHPYDSSPERSSPERRTVRPQKPGDTDKIKYQSKSPRPSSIPRPGRKTPECAEKPLNRQPSWSKTLRGTVQEPQKIKPTTRPSPAYQSTPVGRKPSSPSSSPDRKGPVRNNTRSHPAQSPIRRLVSPSSSPERQMQDKPQRKTGPSSPSTNPKSRQTDSSPVKSAFVRTNSNPGSTQSRAPDVPKKSVPIISPKNTSKNSQRKPGIDDEQSTDRSSTVSSPETIMHAGDITKRTEVFMPQLTQDSEISFVALSDVTGEYETGEVIDIHISKTVRDTSRRTDYFSDDYEDLMDETPPDEFLVEEDLPLESKNKHSSIPMPSNKSPEKRCKTTLTTRLSDTRIGAKKPSTPKAATPKQYSVKPISKIPDKKPTTTRVSQNISKPCQKSKPEQPKTFRSVATIDTRVGRTNSDNNLNRRPVTTTNGVQNQQRPLTKPEPRTPQITVKITNAKARTSVNTVTSVNSRLITGKTVQSSISRNTTSQQKILPKQKPGLEKPKTQNVVSKLGKPTKTPAGKRPDKRVNGASKRPEYDSSSEDEEGLPEECPSLIDTDDDYIREMEELRQDEEAQYALKVTSREDALLSVCQDKLKTSRDSLTIADIRLKSSRESSPDFRGPRSVGDDVVELRPRYADRVSEPEDDDDHFRKPDAVRFQRPILHPDPLDEETDDSSAPSSTPVVPKVYPKSILVDNKQTVSTKTNKDYTALSYASCEYPIRPQEDLDDERPKRPSEYLQKSPAGYPSDSPQVSRPTGYPLYPEDEVDNDKSKAPRGLPPQQVQVTDLDASDTEESTRLLVSVSDRVSHFLETAKSQTVAPAPQAIEPVIPSNLDSPSAVKKARAMFETIATTQKTSPSSPRQMDILSRPSIFEARRAAPGTPPKRPLKESPVRQTEEDNFSNEPSRRQKPESKYPNEYPSDEEASPSNETSFQPHSPIDTRAKTTPKETYSRDKSPPGKKSTDTYPLRKPSSSPERPKVSVSTRRTDTDFTANSTYHNESNTSEKKISTDTFVRRKSNSSPERPKNDIPKDSYRQDKTPPGKICNDTYPRRKSSSSPDRPKHESTPTKISTDTFTRRKSPDRPRDYGTYTKPKSATDKDLPDKYASFPSQSRVSKYPRDASPELPSRKFSQPASQTKEPEDQEPPDNSRRSPSRRDSLPKREVNGEPLTQRKPSSGGYPEERGSSPVRKPSLTNTPKDRSPTRTSPTRQSKETPKVNGSRGSPEREFPRRGSTTNTRSSPTRSDTQRRPSEDKSPSRRTKDALPRDSKRIVSLEESSVRRGSGVFGVALRSTATTTAPTKRRPSADASPKVAPVDEDDDIEKTFDLELLEIMLEKATGYDRRRRLRAQIRIVRRHIEESTSSTTTTTMAVTSATSSSKTVSANNTVVVETQRKQSPQDSGRAPSKPLPTRGVDGSPQQVEPKQSYVNRVKPQGRGPSDQTRSPSSSPERNSQQRPYSPERTPTGRRPSDSNSFPKRQSSPERTPTGRRPSDSNSFPKRQSSPERTPTGRRPSDSNSSQQRSYSPDRKSVGRRPSDTVDFQQRQTSPDRRSQGRRPSDTDNFQKRPTSPDRKPAGRRPSDTGEIRNNFSTTRRGEDSTFVKKHSKTELTIELKPTATSPVKTPVKKWSVGEKPQEVCPVTSSYGVGPTDENGRPLFGLRALRKSHNSQSSIDIESQPTAPKPEESFREVSDRGGRPLFGGLRALKAASNTSSVVSSSTTNKTTTRRDSGSVLSRDTDEFVPDDEMPEQPDSPQLRELVTRHEQQFRGNSTAQPLQKPRAKLRDSFILQTSSSADSKKVEDTTKTLSLRGQSLRSLIQKHESITKDDDTSLVPRSGILKPGRDGVITEGSSVSTVVTSRGTLRSDGTVSLSRDIIKGETVLRPGEEPVTKVTRTQQRYNTPTDKTPAICDVDDEEDTTSARKYSSGGDRFTSSASVTSNTSRTRLENEDTTRSQHKVEDSKFTNSSILSRSKFIDDVRSNRKGSPTRGSPTRTSPEKEGKFTSSTSTVLTRRPSDSTPISSSNKTSSVRRQILNENDDDKISTTSSRQGKFTSSTTVTSSNQVTSFEQKYSTGGSEERRTSQGYIVDYNDDDESDGYQNSGRYIEDCSKNSSPRASPEKVFSGYKKVESKVYSTSSDSRRRSSTTLEDGEKTPTGTKRGVTRGNSVRALQQKFQQAAGSPAGSTPSSNLSTPQADNANRSFLDNQTRVTGVQDILNRMRNADHVVESGDTVEDSEARALLNKFLGAQMILQGMEPLVQATQSATLVSQVERQRLLSTSTSSTSNPKKVQSSAVVNGKEQDIEEIWDEAKLRKLLDNCTDYEARRKIRARLRIVMAEQKACSEIVSAALADEAGGASSGKNNPNVELRSEQGFSESSVKSSSVEGNVTTKTEVTTRTSSFSTSAVGSARVVSKAPSGKVVSPFSKFQQMDRQNSQSAPKTFK